MTKEIHIIMKSKDKEIELRITEPSKEVELFIMGSGMDFLGAKPSEDLIHIQKMYADFYDGSFNPELCETNEEIKVTPEVNIEDLSDTELLNIGMKRNVKGNIIKRCRYICTSCDHTGNHYIASYHTSIPCHRCDTSLDVRESNETGIYYYGGKYEKEEA